MKALAKKEDLFPALSGDIQTDTDDLVGELAIGTMAVERGLARLYLIWRGRLFLNIKRMDYRCSSCGLELMDSDPACPRCGGVIESRSVPVYPTLNDYIAYVSDETGKSRQTIFNRLKIYRVLCDERNINPLSVFSLNLLSPGAAKSLADADEDLETIYLENDSWQETVDKALSFDNKGMALEYIEYDVLRKPRIFSEKTAESQYTVYLEHDSDGDIVSEKYNLSLSGVWTDKMTDWLEKKLGVSKK